MRYTSVVTAGLSTLSIPIIPGERIYMLPFTQRDGLPPEASRYQQVVDDMLHGVEVDGPIYLMVDCSELKAGEQHRRPGLHIDGYWVPDLMAHRGGDSGGGHRGGVQCWKGDGGGGWKSATLTTPEAIFLASNIQACRAFEGTWDGVIGEGGDCSSVDVAGMREVVMRPNTVYRGNVAMLHETLPVREDCIRTVVRLNIPGLRG